MTEQPGSKNQVLPASQSQAVKEIGTAGVAGPAADSSSSAAGDQGTPKKLTPEEQMALYEKDLKENDWGHQPC